MRKTQHLLEYVYRLQTYATHQQNASMMTYERNHHTTRKPYKLEFAEFK